MSPRKSALWTRPAPRPSGSTEEPTCDRQNRAVSQLLDRLRSQASVSPEQWALCVALPFGQVSNMALFVVLAVVRSDLSLSYSELGLVLASFGIARVLTDLPAGALVQRFDPRTALLVSLAGTLLAAVVGLSAASAWQLAAARFIHGITSSVVQCAILVWLVG